MTKQKSLSTALSWTFFSNISTGIINLVSQVVFARILGVEVIGKYAVIVVSVEVIFLLFSFGFNQAVIKYNEKINIFNAAYTLVVFQALSVIIVCSIVFISVPSLHEIVNATKLIVIGYICSRIISLFTTLAYAPLESKLDYKPISISRLISVIIGTVMAFVYIIQIRVYTRYQMHIPHISYFHNSATIVLTCYSFTYFTYRRNK